MRRRDAAGEMGCTGGENKRVIITGGEYRVSDNESWVCASLSSRHERSSVHEFGSSFSNRIDYYDIPLQPFGL